MKKSMTFVLIFLILFLVPFFSAITFDMKESLMEDETLITKVSGYFFEPLIPENILLYREHTRIPMQFEVVKMDEDYYLYADFSKRIFGNYSVIIQNIRHMSVTEATDEDIQHNFTITKEKAQFIINPGVVFASKDFLIEAKSIIDEEIGIDITINQEEEKEEPSEKGFFASLFGGAGTSQENATYDFTLSPGETQDIPFSLELFEQGINFIGIHSENLSYRIPVFVFVTTGEPEEKTEFRFEPSELNISLDTDSEISRMIYLFNSGKTTINNISISLSNSLEGLVTLSDYNVDQIKNGSSIPIEISVLPSETKKIIDGHVKAKINEGTQLLAYSQIHLSFIPGYVINKTTEIPTSLKPCAEIQGTICQANLECSGEQIQASDGICCLGTCVPPKKTNAGKIIGIIVFVVVVGFLIWFYLKKYKKKEKKEVNLLDVAKEGTEKK